MVSGPGPRMTLVMSDAGASTSSPSTGHGWIAQYDPFSSWWGRSQPRWLNSYLSHLSTLPGPVTDVAWDDAGRLHVIATSPAPKRYTLTPHHSEAVWIERIGGGRGFAPESGSGFLVNSPRGSPYGIMMSYAASDCASEIFFQGLGCTQSSTITVSSSWAGSLLSLSLFAAPPSLPWGFVVFGLDSSSAYPLNLSSIGIGPTVEGPCWWYNSLDVVVPASAWPYPDTTISIPNAPYVVGLELGCQALVPEPGANAAGLVVTTALKVRIGAY